ncbi:MAG: hypothetical protein EOS23_33320, partial [Mesorhizobium sp.]
VAYRFEDSRGGECVARHLEGYRGILQVDGYAAYKGLAQSAGANDGVILADCFAHVRRKFYELHVNSGSELATETVTTMARLWQIEDDARGQVPSCGSGRARKTPRPSSPISSTCGKRSSHGYPAN